MRKQKRKLEYFIVPIVTKMKLCDFKAENLACSLYTKDKLYEEI